MAVKSKPQTESRPTVEDDLVELASMVPLTLHDLKNSVPAPMPMRDAMERTTLGKRHASALLAIAATEPVSVSELARRLGLLLSSTSTIVGELSRAGLIQRAEDDQDRRRTIVRVHEDYRDAMEVWLELALAPMRNTLERLTPQARRHFLEGWRVLGEEAAAHASGAEGCDD
jgi:DNA-binding MarR family transcriptional regulator